jgi:hypothetical protein
MLRIRFQYQTGMSLGYSIERLADGLYFDFADSTFRAAPATIIAPLPEDAAPFAGRYKANLPSPAGQFADGDYTVTVHHLVEDKLVLAELSTTMLAGDDASIATPEAFARLVLQALAGKALTVTFPAIPAD